MYTDAADAAVAAAPLSAGDAGVAGVANAFESPAARRRRQRRACDLRYTLNNAHLSTPSDPGASLCPVKVHNNVNPTMEQVASVINTSMLLLSQVMSYHNQVFQLAQPVGEAASARHSHTQTPGAHDHKEAHQIAPKRWGKCAKTTASCGEAAFAHHPCSRH